MRKKDILKRPFSWYTYIVNKAAVDPKRKGRGNINMGGAGLVSNDNRYYFRSLSAPKLYGASPDDLGFFF
jgi:hypothetical protein